MINQYIPPVVIGGVGGSGTRLIAECVKKLGFFMGSDLNDAFDNLWFTLLFKRREILSLSDAEFNQLVDILVKGMSGFGEFTESQIKLIDYLASTDRNQHPADWLRERATSLLSAKNSLGASDSWGWKEPNTQIVIDRLQKYFPNMKYIHVVRNGLDMAHSTNQNQLRLWGTHFLGASYEVSPYYSLKYWHKVTQHVLQLCSSMGSRFLWLNYDRFCLDSVAGIEILLKFLELDATESRVSSLSKIVIVPESINRFKQFGSHLFDDADIAFVKQLGFDTSLD